MKLQKCIVEEMISSVTTIVYLKTESQKECDKDMQYEQVEDLA